MGLLGKKMDHMIPQAELVSHFDVSADWTGLTGMETFKFIVDIPHRGGTFPPLPFMCTILLFL